MIHAHKCRGKKWKPYPSVLCSMCSPFKYNGSIDLTFNNEKEYKEYTESKVDRVSATDC